jgi:Phage integrase family
MAAIYQRRQKWWVRFYHPLTGELIRESLGTSDEARAELLRQRIEFETALLEPRFKAAELPENVCKALGLDESPIKQAVLPSPGEIPGVVAAQAPTPASLPQRLRLDDALKAYIESIHEKNASHHAASKLSMLRRFIGTERVEQFVQDHSPERKSRRLQKASKPYFTGEFVDEITSLLLQEFLRQLDVSTVTKRHYREFFHSFFDYCIKFGLYRPENWHCPNPVTALPSYSSKNHRIIYLTPEDVEAQLKVLEPYPELHIAAAVMIYAGLRREEALWLTRDAFSPDLSFISVVNRFDEDTDIESSLKTGERSVTILPPLRRLLEKYLPTLHGRWVVPMAKGVRWDGNAFARKLRRVNAEAGLDWSSMHYRHTFATQRAAQGWSLLRISHEMGN